MSQSWKTKIDNVRSTYPAVDTIPQVIDDVKFRGKKSVDDSIEKEPYSYLSDDRIMQAQPWIKDVKTLEKLARLFSKYMDEQRVAVQETAQERNQGWVRYSKKGQSQGIFSNKTVDDYTRIQYNSYGWIAVNNIMTVNELNRFYKQFANTKCWTIIIKKL